MITAPVKPKIPPQEYRKPMAVTDWRKLGITYWAICPRCKHLVDREYVKFCESCGQRLAWRIPLRRKPR